MLGMTTSSFVALRTTRPAQAVRASRVCPAEGLTYQ
jgi:hypothetical protein